MQRKILIIDDHDDLTSALKTEFTKLGHTVETVEDRAEAVELDNIENFDLVITDLDNENLTGPVVEGEDTCLPEHEGEAAGERIKAFKICATNYKRDEFSEDELKGLVSTCLDYKAKFVDAVETVKSLREKIEFELPSAIGLMHTVLDYLMHRVEKVGVVNPESSNLFIALDEAFVNAVKHGNKFDANKLIRISAEVSTKEARFTIEDEGEGFDVNAIPDPRDTENLFKTSGRGVLFIYNIMDEVRYNERGNRLTMVKRPEPSKPAAVVKT
jgi:serine/threonine-protein kinase RsbW